MNDDLRERIRCVSDFPRKGIVFRDITTLLKDPRAFSDAIDRLVLHYRNVPVQAVVSVESRGFILGSPLAYLLGAGFVPIRKPGKLPAATVREEYALEYGIDAVEIHKDAISPGQRIIVHDDLLATGGTIQAACRLVERLGGEIVGVSFLIELNFLKGRDRLKAYDVFSLIQYDHE
jgi:adenine phosphoribosyltransferase